MSYGVTSTGFNIKSADVIKAELELEFKAALGDEINVGADSSIGNLIGVLTRREADVWDLNQAVYDSQYPQSAEGTSLDNLCALTGIKRRAATNSTVTETCLGTGAAVLSAGRVFQVENDGARFVTTEAATLEAITAWAINTVYVVGDRRKNSGNIYQCITAGTSAGAGGPTTEAADITDNTAHWKYLGAGTHAVDVLCESEDTGPIAANAETLTEIVTPVAQLTSVLNLLDAEQGENRENDTELRVRRLRTPRVSRMVMVSPARRLKLWCCLTARLTLRSLKPSGIQSLPVSSHTVQRQGP